MGQAQLKQLTHMVINETVVDHSPDFAHTHNALRAQHTQLMRNCRIVPAKASSQITHAKLASRSMQQSKEHLQARWIIENGKKGRRTHSTLQRQQALPHSFHLLRMHRAHLAEVCRLSASPGLASSRTSGHPGLLLSSS